MKKIIILSIILILIFSFNIYAQKNQKLNVAEDIKLEELDLSQEKGFSQSARKELLGIASQFDSEENQEFEDISFFVNENLSLTGRTINNSQYLNILKDLDLDTNYSQKEAEKLETAASFNFEYALSNKTSLRAGYSVLNEEWWDLQNNNGDGKAVDDGVKKTYQNEIESSRSLGLAYRSNDRVTISADFIDNNEFGNYYDADFEFTGDSTVLGVEYNYPAGSMIRARYQVDTTDNDITQKITGVDFAFNNLATFSASYKLLDLNQVEDNLAQQKTAWDLGIGVNITDDYGLALGYELIEGKDEEEVEEKIRASFEINF